MFFKIVVLKIFANFTGNHLGWNLVLIKFIKNRLQPTSFPAKFAKGTVFVSFLFIKLNFIVAKFMPVFVPAIRNYFISFIQYLSLKNKIWNFSLRHASFCNRGICFGIFFYVSLKWYVLFIVLFVPYVVWKVVAILLSFVFKGDLVFIQLIFIFLFFFVKPIWCGKSSVVFFDVILQPQTTLNCRKPPLRGQNSFALQLQCGFGEAIFSCLNIFLLWELIVLVKFGREL